MSGLMRFDELELPQGEQLLWQGAPRPLALALRVFHVRLIAGWFGLLFAGTVGASLLDHQGLREAIAGASGVVVPAAITLTLVSLLAALYSRTTRYSITNRRVLLQFGAALPMTLNVPFHQIASAGLRTFSDGSGDIPLHVTSEKRLAWLLLWPHARPWRLSQVEPMLRSVPDAQAVAAILARALSEVQPVRVETPAPQAIQVGGAIAA